MFSLYLCYYKFILEYFKAVARILGYFSLIWDIFEYLTHFRDNVKDFIFFI